MSDRSFKVWFVQFVKFNIVGLLNTAIDFAVFFLLIWLPIHYAAAQAIAYLAGMANSYIFNSLFTFKASKSGITAPKKAFIKRGLRFLVWNGIMLGLSVLLLAFATNVLHMNAVTGKVAVTALIVAVNFYGSKRWVFAG